MYTIENQAVSAMRSAFAAHEYGDEFPARDLAQRCRELCEQLPVTVAREILTEIAHIK